MNKDVKVISVLVKALKAAEFGYGHHRCSVCAGWDGETEHSYRHSRSCVVAKAIRRGLNALKRASTSQHS